MNVNYELYRVFQQVARLKSFSKAALRLNLTQSAVSQSIKNLENQLGVQLFFRRTRQVTITGEGKLLLAHVDQALNYLRTGEQKLEEIKNLKAGEIHLGASDTVSRYFLLPYLKRFLGRYPGIKLRLFNRTSLQLLDMLKEGAIDCAIVSLPVAEDGLRVQPFLEVRDIWVVSPRYRELRGRKVGWHEISEYPLLLLEKRSSTRKVLDHFLAQQGISLSPGIELESVDLLVQFAAQGLGIAHVVKESAREALRRKELFELHISGDLPRRELGIVYLRQVPLSLAASRLVELLLANKMEKKQ